MSGLLPVDEALARITGSVETPTAIETVPVEEAFGRVLAAPLVATRTQPPFTASAMDGYAVRAGDVSPGAVLALVGESAAGRRYPGRVGAGEAVRIFTGAPVPEGADSILIQENAEEAEGRVTPRESLAVNRHIRPAGLDFAAGQRFFAAGHRLAAKDLALAAALGAGTVDVRRRPRVAVLATGDELVAPGAATGPDQIVASNHLSVMALAKKAGAEPRFFGIAADDLATLDRSIAAARDWGAEILVTLGGASVGDRDLVKAALAAAGLELGFWRIAMRPGKPLMFGRLGAMRVLGLPGNPASAVVCAHLFLKPLIAAFLGEPPRDPTRPGRLAAGLPANDQRQDYLRATLGVDGDGVPVLTPLPAQDSSLTAILAAADALVIRPPHAPPAAAGDACRFLLLD
jgi:molybdopterin molybdotransferase